MTRQGEESVEGRYASILETESRGVVLRLVGGNGIEARPRSSGDGTTSS
jgi:hypothetical protein